MKTTRPASAAARFLVPAVAALLALGRVAAADPAAIFVSEYNGGSPNVPAYSVAGAVASNYSAPAGFQDARGVAYNPANNTLYVADAITNKIRTFNATTGAETQLGFANASGLNCPIGLVLNAGVLYAANSRANTVTAYNAATGATVTTGFTSPAGLNAPFGLAVSATTLYVVNYDAGSLAAFNLATGAAVAGFTPITGLNDPSGGVALYGNDLFVADTYDNIVGEYDATTGLAINANFLTGVRYPVGLAVLGNQLLVAADNTVGAYGIPAVATTGNVPTSANASFLAGLNAPKFIAVVPEPSTWALLGLGVLGVGVALRRRRIQRVQPVVLPMKNIVLSCFVAACLSASTHLSSAQEAPSYGLSLAPLPGAATPLDTFSFTITGFGVNDTNGVYLFGSATGTFGLTQTFTGSGPTAGQTITLTSSETVNATTTTDTITVSASTSFAPVGTTDANGGTLMRVEFELGTTNAGKNTLDFLTPLASPTYAGSVTYGDNQTGTFVPGGVTLSNNNRSLSVSEGFYRTNSDVTIANVRSFTFAVTSSNVPEPSTWAALVAGGTLSWLGVALRRRMCRA